MFYLRAFALAALSALEMLSSGIQETRSLTSSRSLLRCHQIRKDFPNHSVKTVLANPTTHCPSDTASVSCVALIADFVASDSQTTAGFVRNGTKTSQMLSPTDFTEGWLLSAGSTLLILVPR